ncbi:MAG: cadherin-like domain-containing protein [Paraglaciecola sp.]|uniref:Ig-like domain-containing protein n=1 Tax=Paraglaciecola sp. TaxID=1920173 RepID=UPI00273F7819|nr:Ig-like domain-containing protein [Paraglaciecola sp.]MDP5030870.1 cadherin-like domain-containing protein [Paraglaciecola sp.]MDP5131058.1 cadherin-like domain-containing protein [Paraglaciecola sp.]
MKANNSKIALALLCSMGLAGCNFSDDDSPKQNKPPVAVGADLLTQTDTPIMDNLAASDPENDALYFSLATEPMSGTVTVMNNGAFTYTPAANFVGSDSFAFSVSDGINAADQATVNITIETLQLSFSDYSRAAFAQASSDSPLPINGRSFTQDVTDAAAYDDLINN